MMRSVLSQVQRRVFVGLLPLLVMASTTVAQEDYVESGEFRIDKGDSYPLTLGTPVEIPNPDPPPDRSAEEVDALAEVSTEGLSVGPHLLEVGFDSSSGLGSAWFKRWFRVEGDQYILDAEWFLDEDPGPGNGTSISSPDDGAWDETEETITFTPPVDTSTLSPGLHAFYLCTMDQDGNWSAPHPCVFEVVPLITIVAAEYVVDDPDAEPGTGVPMDPVDGAFDSADEDVEAVVDTEGWAAGTHTINVRTKDSLGRWSTRHGLYWDEDSGEWRFDPDVGWTDDSKTTVEVIAPRPQVTSVEPNVHSTVMALSKSMHGRKWL